MVLGSQSETYDTRYEYESSIRYLGFGLHLLNDNLTHAFYLLRLIRSTHSVEVTSWKVALKFVSICKKEAQK